MYLIGLSIKDSDDKLEKSPLLKFRSSATLDPITGKWYHLGLLLRENGRVEIYADFVRVSIYDDHKLQCVDIEMGNNEFYLKVVKDSHKIDDKVHAE